MLIGYARVSTDGQDLTAQRDALADLGVDPARPGFMSTTASPAPTATGSSSPNLDRLARSLPDARAIAEELTISQVKLNLGGSIHDPTDPVGRLLFNALATVAEFEADLARMRAREGMKVARAKSRLRGK